MLGHDGINHTVKKHYFFKNLSNHRSGLEVEHSPRMWEIGVQSSVETDLSHKNR